MVTENANTVCEKSRSDCLSLISGYFITAKRELERLTPRNVQDRMILNP
jgi:hypothetical protein